MFQLLEFGGGIAGGFLLNDVVEKAQNGSPGNWKLTLFMIPGTQIGVGVDDVLQAGAGLVLAAAVPSHKMIGFGITAATVISKASEIAGMPIHIVKHAERSMAGLDLSTGDDSDDEEQNSVLNNTTGLFFSGQGGVNTIPTQREPALAGVGLSIL